MKKFFFCAAAAIVALASCSKTQIVYNDAPQEIGFKAVSGVMTKAPITDTTFPENQPITVYAWNNSDKAAYFGPVDFAKNGIIWKGRVAQYYPTNGSLDFVAYTNESSVVSLTTPTANDSYTYTLTDNSSFQHDFMVSDYIVGKSSSSDAVGIPFSHALALVEVNFKCTGADVTVKSVTLSGTKQAGSVTVTYTNADTANSDVEPTIGAWNVTGDPKSLSASGNLSLTAGENSAKNFANFLVVPETSTGKNLSITYVLNGNTFTDSINLSTIDNATNWQIGKKHVFNITIGLEEITFSPSISADWSEGATSNPTIQ